jgi:hypothetical protein
LFTTLRSFKDIMTIRYAFLMIFCNRHTSFHQKIHQARFFNFTYRYIDDVLSINDSRFAEFLP